MSELDPTAMFRQEAAELLDSLEGTLLDLGNAPRDRELVDQAFRAMHTIKGSGAMFGFDQVASFTHDFETAFDLVRKGEVEVTSALITVALAARDHIRALIEAPDEADAGKGAAILADLETLVGGAAGATMATRSANPSSTPPSSTPPSSTPPSSTPPSARAAASAQVGWQIEFWLKPEVLRNGTDPLALLDEMRELGACEVRALLHRVPAIETLQPQDLHIGWSVALLADCSRQAIDDVFMFVLDDMTLEVTPIMGEAAPAPEPAVATPAPVMVRASTAPAADSQPAVPAEKRDGSGGRRTEDKSSSSVRVQAERLDELMDRVGELVIAQARLSQLAHARVDPATKSIAEEIERLASGLRDITMGIRMVPIGSLFARFRRLIHDLSRDLGKPVEFVTAGEDTELDKTMIERLADPLVHLIRNAIDHGIEQPERRAANGKSGTGRIRLAAEHAGAQVLITVEDDGNGLDATRIRAKAEEQGLIAPGAAMSDAEIYQFLFHPGFSTAQTVSALSGRGVGMDVVKRTIEAMRGTIELSTVPGKGSRVTLRMPLTLAIIEGLLIRVGEGRYVIPLSTIEECVELTPAHMAQSRGRNFLNIRGGLVPFMSLREMFAEPGVPDQHQKIIITSVGDTRVGLLADQIIGSHQTVIKSLSKLHADVTMFSGATILGDGSAALILDVTQLIAMGQVRNENETNGRAA